MTSARARGERENTVCEAMTQSAAIQSTDNKETSHQCQKNERTNERSETGAKRAKGQNGTREKWHCIKMTRTKNKTHEVMKTWFFIAIWFCWHLLCDTVTSTRHKWNHHIFRYFALFLPFGSFSVSVFVRVFFLCAPRPRPLYNKRRHETHDAPIKYL